ncbi:MAG: efflux RND transporter periplasmic adaptor subunit [Bacteroidales bacterium]|nr:efflux RND transporter periplasmic adaptor subunit [Bacteroidales bacterium]
MKRINIKRKEWIRGSLLLAAGILLGALVFSSSGNNTSSRNNQPTTGTPGHDHSHDSMATGEQEQTTWTCSMHPQVRQDEPGQCPICGMDLIEAEESEQSQDPAELKMTEEALKLAEIQTSRVEKKQPTRKIRLTGKVQVDQRKIYVQPSHIPGRIENLSVQFEGQYVKKGQPIATVYSPDLISAQEELLEALKTKESNPQLVEAAREKLRQWKLSEQQIRAIEQEGTVQEHMTIQSDVEGIVHKQMVRQGDYVNKGTRLFHIARIDRVWVMFDAYQKDVPFVEEGDRIAFSVSGVPGKTFTSRVTFVDPLMNEQSRVAQIRTEASNTNGLLKPGMFAEGVLQSAQTGNGKELIVPKSAVMWTGERSVVYVRQQDQEKPVFRMRQVVLGPSLGDTYIIKEGLSEGEQVVTHGTFAVDAAAQLADKPSMMNREKQQSGPQKTHSGHSHTSGSGKQTAEATKQTTASSDIPEKKLLWPDRESEKYQDLVNEYLTLKDQLVGDQKASESAKKLLETLQSVDMSAFSQQAHKIWMDLQGTLTEKSRAILQTGEMKEQRRHFIDLSNAMITLVKTFKSPGSKLFVQFCPMADNDQGAYWLSSQEQIRNPYFGDMMLTCGEVRDEVNREDLP